MTGEEFIKQLGEDVQAASRALRTPDGERLLAVLERIFDRDDLMGADDRALHFNLGARGLVRQLRKLRATGERMEANGRR